MGGAYGIEYYREEDRQWNTDVREAVRGGGKGRWGGDYCDYTIAVKTADPEHGDMYDEYNDDEEMGEGGGEDEE